MANRQVIEYHIEHNREGSYFSLPFTMPPDTEILTLNYRYQRYREVDNPIENGAFTSKQEVNIIDLGLIAPDGSQVGASGSDKNEIILSAISATPGYLPQPLVSGEWRILVGAYKVVPQGVTVKYELTFTPKHLRLLKGDFHTHTVASDGVLTAAELGRHALSHGLDFVAVTDHNQFASAAAFPQLPGLTFIPGIEWTHYQGHANFLGIDRSYDEAFATNTPEETLNRFEIARQRGALIVINHPFEAGCGFQLDINSLPFDCLEIWNGPMRVSNLQAVGLWQSMLVMGKKIPMCGGSDYHRDGLFQILGGPTTCVYAMSSSSEDILLALKQGHAFVIYAPNGPSAALTAGDAIMGDTTAWVNHQKLQISIDGLVNGDSVRIVTAQGSDTILEAPSAGSLNMAYAVKQPGFARLEIWRAFLPGLPMLPALISNPIYFAG